MWKSFVPGFFYTSVSEHNFALIWDRGITKRFKFAACSERLRLLETGLFPRSTDAPAFPEGRPSQQQQQQQQQQEQQQQRRSRCSPVSRVSAMANAVEPRSSRAEKPEPATPGMQRPKSEVHEVTQFGAGGRGRGRGRGRAYRLRVKVRKRW